MIRDDDTPPEIDPPPLHLSVEQQHELLTDSQKLRHRERYPHGTPAVQTAEDRDLAAIKRQRTRSKSYPLGAPSPAPVETDPDQETTDPLALIPRVPDDADIEALRRSGRDPNQPVLTIEFAQVARVIKAQLRKERLDSEERQAQQLLELLDRPPRTVADKLTSDVALIKKIAAALAVLVLGGIGTVAKGLYDRGGRDTAIDLHIQQLQRDRDETHARLNSLLERDDETTPRRSRDRARGRSDPDPPAALIFPPLPTTKGQQEP